MTLGAPTGIFSHDQAAGDPNPSRIASSYDRCVLDKSFEVNCPNHYVSGALEFPRNNLYLFSNLPLLFLPKIRLTTRLKSIADFKQPGTGISEQLSTIDLALPSIAIQGTGSATAYFQGKLSSIITISTEAIMSSFGF